MLLHEGFDEPMVNELRAIVGHWDHAPDQEGTLGGCDVCVCGSVCGSVCSGSVKVILHEAVCTKKTTVFPKGRIRSRDTMQHSAM